MRTHCFVHKYWINERIKIFIWFPCHSCHFVFPIYCLVPFSFSLCLIFFDLKSSGLLKKKQNKEQIVQVLLISFCHLCLSKKKIYKIILMFGSPHLIVKLFFNVFVIWHKIFEILFSYCFFRLRKMKCVSCFYSKKKYFHFG